MKFERDHKAETQLKLMIPGPGMRVYNSHAGDWQFLITYDLLHSIWTASYKPIHNIKAQVVQCEAPDPGQRLKTYETQNLAEQACFHKYQQLREES